ncbi:MAG: GtrA family protein [Clostridia bacterium]|nr:GtrA family protein [Clostridia bacterium]
MEQTTQENKHKEEKNKTIWQAVKFTLFSISAGVVQVLSFTVLNEWIIRDIGQKYGWSYFISLILSVLWNFTFNRKFTFKSANNIPIAMLEVLAYYAVFTPLSIWWGVALESAHWNEYIILGLTMIVNFITEFLWSKYVVFREKKVEPENKVESKEETNSQQNLQSEN